MKTYRTDIVFNGVSVQVERDDAANPIEAARNKMLRRLDDASQPEDSSRDYDRSARVAENARRAKATELPTDAVKEEVDPLDLDAIRDRMIRDLHALFGGKR